MSPDVEKCEYKDTEYTNTSQGVWITF